MILGILVLAFILYISLTYNNEVAVYHCVSGHKWEYGEDDRLICSRCKKRPGEDNE